MKISKTSSNTRVSGAKSRGKGSPKAKASKGSRGSSSLDSVEISSDAIAAAGGDAVEEVIAVQETAADGPLPDPYETSRKMLEKELNLVFKDTYLVDGL